MEHREVLAVILAAAVVILVIGVLGMVRTGSKSEDSVPVIETTARPAITQKTDIWDAIREQQSAMTTTTETTEEAESTEPIIVTDEEGNPVTDEEGNALTETVPEDETAEIVDDPAAETEETQTETVTEAAEETTEPERQEPVLAETYIQITID